jgi:hypothetical protein
MGMRSRRQVRHMKDPVSGVFRIEGHYRRHTSSPAVLTGVIVADGVPPTVSEAPSDNHGKWATATEVPITVDRADPRDFVIDWDRVVINDPREIARQQASDAAARMVADRATPAPQPTAGVPTTGVPAGLSPMVDQALRTAGIDPSFLHSPNANVHVTTSFGGTPDFRSMLAGMMGEAVPGTGVVRAVADAPSLPTDPPGTSRADLTLDVRRPDGSTYPVTTRIGFRTAARRQAIATPGTELPLLVNQNDPGQVRIDLAKLNLP